jgi:hypothetical protein
MIRSLHRLVPRAAESVLAPVGWLQANIEAYQADRTDASLDRFVTRDGEK